MKKLCHVLVLVFLSIRATTLGKTTECGEERSCAILAELMSTVNEINDQLGGLNAKVDRLATDLEVLKTDSNKTLASTASISSQLGRHSTDFLSHDGRLRTHDVSQRNEYQLVQSEWT